MASRLASLLAAIACSAAAAPLPVFAASLDPGLVVQVPGPLGPLRGLLLPAHDPRAPLAIIVPGSGPTDRDGNSPAGVRSATYRLLAEDLAARGISVARVDKRGMFSSAQAVADANDVTLQDYASDVRAWARELRRASGVRCAWVIGHSEGGVVALLAGAADPDICGVILLATPGRPLGSILRDQLQSNPANRPLLESAGKIIGVLESGRHVDPSDIPPPLLPLFHPRVQNFLISAMSIDPSREIARSQKPLLIVQGGRDVQVSVEDAYTLARAGARSELVLVPEANHVLKHVAVDDRAANLATYADPSLPIANGVVSAVAEFIARH